MVTEDSPQLTAAIEAEPDLLAEKPRQRRARRQSSPMIQRSTNNSRAASSADIARVAMCHAFASRGQDCPSSPIGRPIDLLGETTDMKPRSMGGDNLSSNRAACCSLAFG